MNREIKFRQMILVNDKPTFHYWGLFDGKYIEPKTNQTTMYAISPQKALEDSDEYIGRKDRQGKEIYEGDFVLSPLSLNKYIVFWDDAAFHLKQELAYNFILTMAHLELEVVGNIYEGVKDEVKS